MNPPEKQNPGEAKASPKPIEIWVDDDITLKQMTMDDSEPLFEIIDRNRDHLSQFGDETAANYPTLESYQLRLAATSPGEYRFGIWDQDEAVGFIKITKTAEDSAEIGYWLGAEYTGHGYMTKSAEALSKYAIESLGVSEVTARVAKENINSLKVLQSVGYEIVGDDPKDSNQYLLRYVKRAEVGPEPFRSALEHVREGTISELLKIADRDHLLIRAEPYNEGYDYPAFNKALKEFEKHSGLAVAPHAEAIGMAKSDELTTPYMRKSGEDDIYKALFHVIKRVDGIDPDDGFKANLDVPLAAAEKLISGMVDYLEWVSANDVPYLYEIRVGQFRYGVVKDTETPQWYMLDLDYALGDKASSEWIVGTVKDCRDFLLEYTPDPIFRPVAEQILSYIRGLLGGQREIPERQKVEEMELDLLDYLDTLDHL